MNSTVFPAYTSPAPMVGTAGGFDEIYAHTPAPGACGLSKGPCGTEAIMNDDDFDEKRMLDAARRGLSPSLSDQARVRVAMTAALAAGTTALTTTSTASAASSAASEAVRSVLAKLGAFAPKAFILSAAIGASAGAGYYVGLEEGRSENRAIEARSAPERATSKASKAHQAQPIDPAPVGAPEQGEAAEPAAAAVPMETGEGRQNPGPTRAPGSAASSTVQTSEAEDDPVQAELRALRRIERALRDENPRLALALLDELDVSNAASRLTQERATARAVARCQSAPETRASVLREFAERYPKSVYLNRIEQACRSVASSAAEDG